jgi:tripartite-type tricarboxylate transporter receptor subunit TctC
LAAIALLASPCRANDGEFYKGKQITVIVSSAAGGAYDAYARLLAQVLGNHLAGHPSILVQNMPGASGLKTANYMDKTAARDGTVIAGTHSSVPSAPLTARSAANFDATKFSWIGSITSDPYIAYVWHTAPIQTLEDAKTTEVIMGGISVGSAGVDLAIAARELFGYKFKIVTGYKSSTEVKLAMERGEVHGTFANALSSIKASEPEWITEKKIRIIAQHGFKRHPELPDVPMFMDLAKKPEDRQILVFLLARQQAAKPYFGPPGVPADRLNSLRRAFDSSIRDPKFIDAAQKSGVSLDDPMTGEELADLVQQLAQTPSPVIDRVNRMFAEYKK